MATGYRCSGASIRRARAAAWMGQGARSSRPWMNAQQACRLPLGGIPAFVIDAWAALVPIHRAPPYGAMTSGGRRVCSTSTCVARKRTCFAHYRVEGGEEVIIDRVGTPVAKIIPLVRRANRHPAVRRRSPAHVGPTECVAGLVGRRARHLAGGVRSRQPEGLRSSTYAALDARPTVPRGRLRSLEVRVVAPRGIAVRARPTGPESFQRVRRSRRFR